MVKIRSIVDTDHAAILDLVGDLAEWFDVDARRRAIPIDLKYQFGFVAEAGGRIVGFVTLFVAEGRGNIGWLGVRKDCQREGIGGRLLSAVENMARDMGVGELATYTLGDSVDYQPYEQTRAFYLKYGFKVYQRSKTDNPGCPEEIKISKRIVHGN